MEQLRVPSSVVGSSTIPGRYSDRVQSATNAGAENQPFGISTKNERLGLTREAEHSDFIKLDAGMQPRPVRPKENFAGPGTLHRLYQVIKTPNTGRVRVHVRIANELLNHALVRAPVVGETSEVRDDEIYILVLRREHVHNVRLARDVH